MDLMTRRRLFKIAAEKLLPPEYQQTQYIKWPIANAYINTGIYPDNTTIVEVTFAITRTGGGNAILGAANTNSGTPGYILGTPNWARIGKNSTGISFPSFETDTLYTVRMSITGLTINGIDYPNTNAEFSTALTNWLALGQRRQNNSMYGQAVYGLQIYACKIWQNGTKARDYISCYRKSDNEAGLYNLVNDTFFVNNGQGTIIAGPDIN